jgi:hypothetical protein
MGIEPTGRAGFARPNGFEDRGRHQACERLRLLSLLCELRRTRRLAHLFRERLAATIFHLGCHHLRDQPHHLLLPLGGVKLARGEAIDLRAQRSQAGPKLIPLGDLS